MAETYKVSIKGPGVDVERDLDEALAQKVLVAVLTGSAQELSGSPQRRAPSGGDDVLAAGVLDEHADSLANFIAAAEATNVPQKITAIGLFLKKHRATPTFDREALVKGFPDAGESVPKNLPRDLKKTIGLGWIAAKPGEEGKYYVTGTGAQAVASRFAGAAKHGKRRGKRKARSAS